MATLHEILNSSDKLAPAAQLNKEKAMVMPDATSVYGMRLYTMSELMSHEFPDTVWTVDSLIPEGITVLSAVPASFKTWLLLAIAISVASGNPLFNHFVTEQTGVLMIDEENSARLLQQRLKMLGAENELPIHFLVEQDFKLEDKQITRVIQLCEDKGIGLITFDSLVRIHRGTENDATQMAEVFSKIRRFTKAGITVLITHHHRKTKSDNNPAQDMRGSSDILAAVDCHIALTRYESNRLVLTQTKVRFAEEHAPVEIDVVSTKDELAFRYVGTMKPSESKKAKTITAIMLLLEEQGEMNQKELMVALEDADNKVNAKTLRNILNDLVGREELNKLQGKGSELKYTLNS
jgi:hypothetical protein